MFINALNSFIKKVQGIPPFWMYLLIGLKNHIFIYLHPSPDKKTLVQVREQ